MKTKTNLAAMVDFWESSGIMSAKPGTGEEEFSFEKARDGEEIERERENSHF